MSILNKICKQCKCIFKTYRRHRQFCSRQCYQAWAKKKFKKKVFSITVEELRREDAEAKLKGEVSLMDFLKHMGVDFDE